jgi:hypothetical protein
MFIVSKVTISLRRYDIGNLSESFASAFEWAGIQYVLKQFLINHGEADDVLI